MQRYVGRVGALRNMLAVAAALFFAGGASAAFYSEAKEFKFPQDNFAILTHTDPEVIDQPTPPGRIYSFKSPAFDDGVMFSVNVTSLDSKITRSDREWQCYVARNGRDIVSVTQSGLTGLQFVDDQTMQGVVVAQRVFVTGGKIYVVTAWGEDPTKPSEFAGRTEMMEEFLNSWRLLDRPKESALPKLGEAVSCGTNSAPKGQIN